MASVDMVESRSLVISETIWESVGLTVSSELCSSLRERFSNLPCKRDSTMNRLREDLACEPKVFLYISKVGLIIIRFLLRKISCSNKNTNTSSADVGLDTDNRL